jgi:hypothetical protein
MVLLLLFNAVILLVAVIGLSFDCVGLCWSGAKLGDYDDVQFISKHFMQCKYADLFLEQAWPWIILFLSWLLFTQWMFSVELLLLVHLYQMLSIVPQSWQKTSSKLNSIETQILLTELRGSNTIVQIISRIAFVLSCTGLAFVVFFDMESFPADETCISAIHQEQFANIHPETFHFVGFSLLFAGIGIQHLCAAAVYYYLVLPSTDNKSYRAYYVGLDGIFVLLFALFVIMYTILVDIQASIYMEYVLVFSVLLLSAFNVIVSCRMLHRVAQMSSTQMQNLALWE